MLLQAPIDSATKLTVSRQRLVLALLLLVYILNFLDRQILGILAQPIKEEFELTDTQLGALGGIAFALFYSVLGLPMAMLADKTSRSWVITVSLAGWSLFTALCGFAQGFWQLFLCRLGVGIGEAGGVAPSHALITEHFSPRRRARAMAVYSLGVPLGMASGALLGGFLARDWRTAFIVAGVAGFIIAPIFKRVVTDVSRDSAQSVRVPVRAAFSALARNRSFWIISFAAALSSIPTYGLAFWVPSLMVRSFGLDVLSASQFVSSLFLFGGTLGVLAGGWLADHYGAKDVGAYAILPAIAWLITVPLFAGGFFAISPALAWVLFVIPHGLNILWLSPVYTAIQHLVPSNMRATAASCALLIVNLVGLGLGSLVMGAMSDSMTQQFGREALRYSAAAALIFYVVAAVLMLSGVRSLRRDWVSDRG